MLAIGGAFSGEECFGSAHHHHHRRSRSRSRDRGQDNIEFKPRCGGSEIVDAGPAGAAGDLFAPPHAYGLELGSDDDSDPVIRQPRTKGVADLDSPGEWDNAVVESSPMRERPRSRDRDAEKTKEQQGGREREWEEKIKGIQSRQNARIAGRPAPAGGSDRSCFRDREKDGEQQSQRHEEDEVAYERLRKRFSSNSPEKCGFFSNTRTFQSASNSRARREDYVEPLGRPCPPPRFVFEAPRPSTSLNPYSRYPTTYDSQPEYYEIEAEASKIGAPAPPRRLPEPSGSYHPPDVPKQPGKPGRASIFSSGSYQQEAETPDQGNVGAAGGEHSLRKAGRNGERDPRLAGMEDEFYGPRTSSGASEEQDLQTDTGKWDDRRDTIQGGSRKLVPVVEEVDQDDGEDLHEHLSNDLVPLSVSMSTDPRDWTWPGSDATPQGVIRASEGPSLKGRLQGREETPQSASADVPRFPLPSAYRHSPAGSVGTLIDLDAAELRGKSPGEVAEDHAGPSNDGSSALGSIVDDGHIAGSFVPDVADMDWLLRAKETSEASTAHETNEKPRKRLGWGDRQKRNHESWAQVAESVEELHTASHAGTSSPSEATKQAQIDFVRRLVGCQRSNGSFAHLDLTKDEARALFGPRIISVLAALKYKIAPRGHFDLFTAAAVVLLRRDFQSCKSYWDLAESKAVEFLRSLAQKAEGEGGQGPLEHELATVAAALEGCSLPPTAGSGSWTQRGGGREGSGRTAVYYGTESGEESDDATPRELVTQAPTDW